MKLLVNDPSGAQRLIEILPGGGYFDLDRVVWDERADGATPAITLGGMVRQGSALVFSQARKDQHDAALAPALAEAARLAETDAETADSVYAIWRAKSRAQFKTDWTALTAAQKLEFLGRVAFVVVRRG